MPGGIPQLGGGMSNHRSPTPSMPGGIPQVGGTRTNPIVGQFGGGYQPATQKIDGANPSLRGSQIGFNIPTQTFNPVTMQAPTGLDFGGFSVDPSSFSGGVSSGGGGFNVNAKSVQDQAMKTFFSQLPKMNIDFADQADQLAQKTAAMGRTGSGLFNRDTGYLSDRSLASRESMLGNIGLQAATTDAGNDLQAQMATGGFDQASKQRAMQASMSNSSNALQAALANAQMNQSGQMFDVTNQMNANQWNAGQQNQAGLWNAQNAQQMGLAGLAHTLGERGYQDQLANQAQNDLMAQMGFFGQGFQGNPAQYDLQGAGAMGDLAGMFGSNAAQTSAGMGAAGGSIAQMLQGQSGGGGIGGAIGGALSGLFGGGQQGTPGQAAAASIGSGIAAPMLAGIF